MFSARDKDEIASRVPDALIPRENRSLKKPAATRNSPVFIPYDKSGSKFDPPPNDDLYRPVAVAPPYKTYGKNDNDVDSEEYRPVRVAKGYEDRYDANYNPAVSEDSAEGSSKRFKPRPLAEPYHGPPSPPADLYPSQHDAGSSRHQDFSGEQQDPGDFRHEDKRHYDTRSPRRTSPTRAPPPRGSPTPLAMYGRRRNRGFDDRPKEQQLNEKFQPLDIVYALSQDDGTFRLQQARHQKAIQIKVEEPNEVINLPQFGLSIDGPVDLQPTENVVLQDVGEQEQYSPTYNQQTEPPDHSGFFVTSGTESDPTRSSGLLSTMSRWNLLGGWGIRGLFERKPKSFTQTSVNQEILLNHPRLPSRIGVPLESIRFHPSPGHGIIATHSPIAKRSDTSSVDFKSKNRRRRSADAEKTSSPTKDSLKPLASGFMPRYSEDDDGYYTPYTLRTIASLANIFRATDDDKEESVDHFATQRAQPRYEQTREPRADTRDHQEANHDQLGSGNFEVIRGGIFNEEVSNNHLTNNNYYTNNPYRATVVQEQRRERQQGPSTFESFDEDPDDQVFGFQGFEDFSAPLSNALSRHRHLLGAAASEKKERKEPLSKSKEDHLPSATERFIIVNRKMLAEE